ncbi:hypothetical protein F5144DRAFT_515252 [Chaetomium tenue]|uniref:Uncharacterized protein n=1 Tax=Chaetomium tenue TaxID=1854479 RepID=A0ACB7P2G0_9PEZI|nr:hypothetical protein F5144DRAFT_515252 [Chaetomium globosum]
MANYQVHVANNSGKDIYVLASPNLHWAIVDIAVDAALIAVGVGELGVAMRGIKAGGWIKSISELALCLKNWAALASATSVVGSRKAAEIADITRAARQANEEINSASIRIPNGSFHRVVHKDWIDRYTQLSGYAGMVGGRTVQLLVKNEDGSQAALFCTGPDDSWIATNRGSIVPAAYGRIWVERSGDWTVDWPKASVSSSPVYVDDGEPSSYNDSEGNDSDNDDDDGGDGDSDDYSDNNDGETSGDDDDDDNGGYYNQWR